MLILPESPRFYVMKGKIPEANKALAKLRGLPQDNEYVEAELEEIIANYNYENSISSSSILDCFKPTNHQLKRILIGIAIQGLQQLTGINFIFYYGTQFFQNSGIKNPFIIQLIMNVVNVVMTIPGIALVEIAGRRNLLLWGAIGMCVSELIVASVGTALPDSYSANKTLIAFSCTFIASFASTWGPLAWVVVGEIFPLTVRAKSVAVCAASNWLFNFAIAYATPYLVDSQHANLQSKVFFIWGGCTFLCFLFVYFFIYETKGLTLEQIDELFESCPSARHSKRFVPSTNSVTQSDSCSESGKAVVEAIEKV
ncbi:LAFA_0C04632g1_1 [Lachancea sp. 'fantastica']|nr:LAFA_0C04632g1_1 [Lachancea sp. 'fantastica']